MYLTHMPFFAYILAALLCSFLWRVRGGLLNSIFGRPNPYGLNDTAVRAIWAVGGALVAWYFHGLHWYWGLAMAAALFVEATIGWWGAALMPSNLDDVLVLSGDGVARTVIPSLILMSPVPLLSGVLCGPAYWAAARLPAPKPWMFWGEWFFGFVLGLGLSL